MCEREVEVGVGVVAFILSSDQLAGKIVRSVMFT